MTNTYKSINPTINNSSSPGYLTSSQLHSTYGAVPIGTISPGQIYTTNGTGTNSFNWQNPVDTVLVAKQDPAQLEVTGQMIINGVDLEERLKTIEKVLCIPERDVILEQKHPKLKKLYDEYITALGKYRTFESIKGDE
jgi:hypothetical protein